MAIQAERSSQTRAAILEAAETALAQEGYAATSVDEICRGAGVSKGAFYHHFSSKEQVFLMLLGGWLAGLEDQLERLRGEASSISEALVTMTGLLGDILGRGGGQLPMYLEFWIRATRDPFVLRELIEPYRRYRDFFTEMLQGASISGVLVDDDPAATGRVIVALAVGLLIQGFLSPEEADWEATARHGIQTLLAGLSTR